jgi:valyl-tRNA synthetase
MLEEQRTLLAFLARLDDAQLLLTASLEEKPHKAIALVAPQGVEAYLPLAGLVDLDQEIARLRKALSEAEREIERGDGRLANQQFIAKAPQHVIEKDRERLAVQRERRDRLVARLKALES